MHVRKLWTVPVVLAALCPLQAQVGPDTTLSISIVGTVGPVLSGSDPLGANGGSGSLLVVASESLSPTSTTTDSATYTLPPGAITVSFSGTTLTTTSSSKMKITLPAKGKDTIVLTATVKESGVPVTVVGTAALQHGSFPSSVLTHPAPFSPSPQTLTAATSATGPGSKIKYTFLGSTTVLGFSGSASDSAALDPVLPDDDSLQ
jgi:carbon monoxide dehydrogenase subunit G